jgi:hypothetical protein
LDQQPSFKILAPGRRHPADTVEKLRFASGAKIHEEFDSILRAITSND